MPTSRKNRVSGTAISGSIIGSRVSLIYVWKENCPKDSDLLTPELFSNCATEFGTTTTKTRGRENDHNKINKATSAESCQTRYQHQLYFFLVKFD